MMDLTPEQLEEISKIAKDFSRSQTIVNVVAIAGITVIGVAFMSYMKSLEKSRKS